MTIDELMDDILSEYHRIKAMAEEDMEIDDLELDRESVSVPKLYGKYLDEHFNCARRYMDLKERKDTLYLERWRYYMGKQTDQYYAKNPLHEKVLKTDVDKYMLADPMMIKMNRALNLQKSVLEYVEGIMKEIQRRGFHIRAAIDYIKFQNGE